MTRIGNHRHITPHLPIICPFIILISPHTFLSPLIPISSSTHYTLSIDIINLSLHILWFSIEKASWYFNIPYVIAIRSYHIFEKFMYFVSKPFIRDYEHGNSKLRHIDLSVLYSHCPNMILLYEFSVLRSPSAQHTLYIVIPLGMYITVTRNSLVFSHTSWNDSSFST